MRSGATGALSSGADGALPRFLLGNREPPASTMPPLLAPFKPSPAEAPPPLGARSDEPFAALEADPLAKWESATASVMYDKSAMPFHLFSMTDEHKRGALAMCTCDSKPPLTFFPQKTCNIRRSHANCHEGAAKSVRGADGPAGCPKIIQTTSSCDRGLSFWRYDSPPLRLHSDWQPCRCLGHLVGRWQRLPSR